MTRLAAALGALRAIRDARDHNADHGRYPPPPAGPDHEQLFDDWAADLAGAAMGAVIPEHEICQILANALIHDNGAAREIASSAMPRIIATLGSFLSCVAEDYEHNRSHGGTDEDLGARLRETMRGLINGTANDLGIATERA